MFVGALIIPTGCVSVQSDANDQGCPQYKAAAQHQIDKSTTTLRSVQDAPSESAAQERTATGLNALRTGLTTMRDRGDCFKEEDRAWAVQQLEAWDGDKAFENFMGCYYVKVENGVTPDFCDLRN